MATICIKIDAESYKLVQHMAMRSPQQDISTLIIYLLEIELSRVSEIDRDIQEKLELYKRNKREGRERI